MEEDNNIINQWNDLPEFVRAQNRGVRPDSFMLIEDDLFLTLGQILLGIPVSEQNRISPNYPIALQLSQIMTNNQDWGRPLTHNFEVILQNVSRHQVFNGITPIVYRYNGDMILGNYPSVYGVAPELNYRYAANPLQNQLERFTYIYQELQREPTFTPVSFYNLRFCEPEFERLRGSVLREQFWIYTGPHQREQQQQLLPFSRAFNSLSEDRTPENIQRVLEAFIVYKRYLEQDMIELIGMDAFHKRLAAYILTREYINLFRMILDPRTPMPMPAPRPNILTDEERRQRIINRYAEMPEAQRIEELARIDPREAAAIREAIARMQPPPAELPPPVIRRERLEEIQRDRERRAEIQRLAELAEVERLEQAILRGVPRVVAPAPPAPPPPPAPPAEPAEQIVEPDYSGVNFDTKEAIPIRNFIEELLLHCRCPICYIHYKNRYLACGHQICSQCLPRTRECPMCRVPIRFQDVKSLFSKYLKYKNKYNMLKN